MSKSDLEEKDSDIGEIMSSLKKRVIIPFLKMFPKELPKFHASYMSSTTSYSFSDEIKLLDYVTVKADIDLGVRHKTHFLVSNMYFKSFMKKLNQSEQYLVLYDPMNDIEASYLLFPT